MYRGKDRKALPLFPELFPFGGQLDSDNRWLKIESLITWEEIESKYSKYFSDIGRPASDCRLVIGLLLLKHMTGLSDDGIVALVTENPYMQVFCGFDQFVTKAKTKKKLIIDPSTLSNARKRLGKTYFAELEGEAERILVERKIIKGRGMMLDATVFPEYIRYPTDTGLLNEAREWTVRQIKRLGRELGTTVRTHCRSARKAYLNFSKKRTKSRKLIRKATKSLLQYLRRNVKQMQVLVDEAGRQGIMIGKNVLGRFDVVRTVIDQQYEMYRRKMIRIEDRIVSLHRPWTRPIVRGKSGDKRVEFGPKASLSYVDGFVFLDHMSSDNFAEADRVNAQIEHYESLFGHKPPYVTADKIYGNHENRKLLANHEIRSAFEPLGRKARLQNPSDRWRKQKQRERNRIEGSFGHVKNHFDLDKIKYYIEDGPEIWVRLGLVGMNLQTALKRI
jgi:IS5 family transposase